MIPIKNMEWHGYWNGVDLRMTIDLQLWSKRLGTLKEMRRENTPCLLKSYSLPVTMLGIVVEGARSCCLPSPQLGGGGGGGGEEKMSQFHQLLRYCPNIAI